MLKNFFSAGIQFGGLEEEKGSIVATVFLKCISKVTLQLFFVHN